MTLSGTTELEIAFCFFSLKLAVIDKALNASKDDVLKSVRAVTEYTSGFVVVL